MPNNVENDDSNRPHDTGQQTEAEREQVTGENPAGKEQQPPPPPPTVPPVVKSPEWQQLSSTRSLLTAANIMGLVSIVVGGVLLSGAALVCSIVVYRRLGRLRETNDRSLSRIVPKYQKIAIASIVVCALILVLNAVALYLYAPIIMEAVETGDFSGLLGDEWYAGQGYDGATQSGETGESAWG